MLKVVKTSQIQRFVQIPYELGIVIEPECAISHQLFYPFVHQVLDYRNAAIAVCPFLNEARGLLVLGFYGRKFLFYGLDYLVFVDLQLHGRQWLSSDVSS